MILEHEKELYASEQALKQLEIQQMQSQVWSSDELDNLRHKLQRMKETTYSNLSPIDRVAICRHPDRPKSQDYIKHLFTRFEELHGDRLFRDDMSIICGIGYINDVKCAVVAQEKGSNTEERIRRNFGMTYPEGYRKALRVMKCAEKFRLPVISLVDTPGAYPGLEAEERGQGWAIAENLRQMASLQTPTIALLIGEGCSGGALGIGVCDRIIMLEHAYYSVISPEGCASILWKDAKAKDLAAKQLKLHPENLIGLSIVDRMIKEPLGGAHYNPKALYHDVKHVLLEELLTLSKQDLQHVLDNRYNKYRNIGRCVDSPA